MSEQTLDIEGMTCASCANRIERKLNRLPGVEATVNYATEKASIRSEGVPREDLVAAVEAAGYAVRAPAAPRSATRCCSGSSSAPPSRCPCSCCRWPLPCSSRTGSGSCSRWARP
ncbi:hypothetical protein GCM10025874_22190 [Arenivirga flava]|uniref:HMA domain-containing protein n=1 Tax=Arenivirga flava TaxID=1930060 RepID=A0AA37XBS6_9MICO|nr:hypothetical protein GCM10025874_22190 [Arenivirga flava]